MSGEGAGGHDAAARLAESRELLRTATARLLGDTIAVAEADWRGPSRLPGWSRGHVATHVARQADALVRLCRWARTGEPEPMYASPQQRDSEIEAGADRPGIDLQIDLDTSSGALDAAFEEVAAAGAWDAPVEMRGGLHAMPRLLPVARLTEVVLHHVDLDIGYDMDDVDDTVAAWLLEWSAFRLRRRDEFPRLDLVSTSGLNMSIGNSVGNSVGSSVGSSVGGSVGGSVGSSVGSSGEPRRVRGSNARLLGWLTSRLPPDDVDGADGLRLPPF